MNKTKNKKIVLATSPGCMVEMWYSQPLGIAYVASCLQGQGYNVEIVDSLLNRYNTDKAAHAISTKMPDAVGLTAFTDNRFGAIELSNKLKKLNPNIFIFAGGPHFSVTAEDALRNVLSIDAVVVGEGEYTAAELLNAYFKGEPLDCVKGICFRSTKNTGEIITTPKPDAVEDLDSLPLPAHHLLEMGRYGPLPSYLTNLTKQERKLPAAAVISSRGCPNSCIFCANNSSALKTPFRKRTPASFVDEIQLLKQRYGFKIFNFWDDTLTLSKEHVLGICDEIIKRSLGIKWYARARVNTVDREILSKMKEAGCIAVLYGAESGSERILRAVKKNITVEQIKNAVRDTVSLDMDVLLGFMVSFPDEKREDIFKTLSLVKELRSYSNRVFDIDLSPTVIYPGTVMEKIALNEGRVFPKDFLWNKKYEFKKNKQLLIAPTVPIYVQRFTLEELMAFRIKNKYQQRTKQPRIKVLIKIIRFITSIKSFSDIKTIFRVMLSFKVKGQ